MKVSRIVLATVACLALGSGGLSPALAQDEEAGVDQPYVTPIGDDEPASEQHVVATTNVEDDRPDPIADVLSLVADTLFSLGEQLGFAGLVVDPENRSIALHWKGNLPPLVSTYLQTASLLGITVTVKEGADLTRVEGQQAASNITDTAPLVEAAAITAVAVKSDGSGVSVETVGAEPDAATKVAIASAAGIDASLISYEMNVGELVELDSRVNDAAPWKGGGRIYIGNSACTTGFAVLSGSAGRLLAAEHCGRGRVRDGAEQQIAPSTGVQVKANIDSMSIDPSASPATAPLMYAGAWNTGTKRTVKNWAANWTGDIICAGGATTGSNCGRIVNDAVSYPGHTGAFYIKARATSGSLAGGADSGGPVYRSTSGGVQARGQILAGYNDAIVSCPSNRNPDVNPRCHRDIIYLPISVALNSWNYRLEVG